MKKILILLLISLIAGCATTPRPFPMKPNMVSDFHINQSITIKNTASSEVFIKWTNATIDFLAKELEAKGATVVDNATRVLKVRITKISQNAFWAYWACKCIIILTVETGDGYKKEFTVGNVSGLNLQRACDFCITKAVATILNDKEILRYISKK